MVFHSNKSINPDLHSNLFLSHLSHSLPPSLCPTIHSLTFSFLLLLSLLLVEKTRLFTLVFCNQIFFLPISPPCPVFTLATPTEATLADQAYEAYAQQQYQEQQHYQAWYGYQQQLQQQQQQQQPSVQQPQHPTAAPVPPTSSEEYTAYYQSHLQAHSSVPGQQLGHRPPTAEELHQQHVAYYNYYGYAAPVDPATAAASAQPPPPGVTPSVAPGQPTAAAASSTSASAYPYSDYYSQQYYQYPNTSQQLPAAAAPYAYSVQPPAPTSHAPASAAARAQTLTSHPYYYQQPYPPPSSYSAEQHTVNHSSSSGHPVSPTFSKYNQHPSHHTHRPNNQHHHPASTSSSSSSGQARTGTATPAFDFQAFQQKKRLEEQAKAQQAALNRNQNGQNTQSIDLQNLVVQRKISEVSLEDKDDQPNSKEMGRPLEKPAYLKVKSKKVKPSTNNVLDVEKSEPVTTQQTEGWPQSLKDYVQRVFEAIADEDRDEAHQELKALISKYHSQNKLWDIKWEEMEVPEKFQKKKKNGRRLSVSPEPMGLQEQLRREKRARRFEAQLGDPKPVARPKPVYVVPVYNADVIDWDEYTVVGTCTTLEKNYLRLTSAPDPATVRPVPVLKKTLDLLKVKWREERNYTYICDQFKSLRQDLTVQRIKNEFTVTVYEIHARIALERSDLGEYNQCQTQLKQLYQYGIAGNVMEFTAYRILYQLHTRNPSDIIDMLASLTPEQKRDPAVKHALKVRTALASANYCSLFRLYQQAPNMGGYLMDQFVERERVQAMKAICKAYRPSIEVAYLQTTLGFQDGDECFAFLTSLGVTPYLQGEESLDTKLAALAVMEAGKRFQMIDIKGQI